MSGYILIKITKLNLGHVWVKEFQQKYRFLAQDMTTGITVYIFLFKNRECDNDKMVICSGSKIVKLGMVRQ